MEISQRDAGTIGRKVSVDDIPVFIGIFYVGGNIDCIRLLEIQSQGVVIRKVIPLVISRVDGPVVETVLINGAINSRIIHFLCYRFITCRVISTNKESISILLEVIDQAADGVSGVV